MCFWFALLCNPALANDATGCDLPADWRQSPRFEAATWQHIQDGDTLVLQDGRKVRLIGIDTPELARNQRPAQPLAEGAKQTLQQAFTDPNSQQVVLRVGEDGRDRYGRVLAHVFSAQGVNLTALLLRAGWGFQVTIPPNLWAADCYYTAEQQARQHNRGVWAHAYFAPRDANDAQRLVGGHGLYTGQIERITARRDWVWVDLVGDISVRFQIKHAEHLRSADFQQLLMLSKDPKRTQHWRLEARGWLVDRSQWGGRIVEQIAAGKRNRWQLDVRHRLQWHLLAPDAQLGELP